MDFHQAEKKFKQLKAQFEEGKLTETAFKTQLEELMVQDEGGNWWMIGYETEKWYRHDGMDWVQTDPPSNLSKESTPLVPTEPEMKGSQGKEKAAREKEENNAIEKNGGEITKKEEKEQAKHETAEKTTYQTAKGEQSKPKNRTWMTYGAIISVAVFLCIALGIWGIISLFKPSSPSTTPNAPTKVPTQPAATEAPAAGNLTFVLVPKNLGNPYFDTANKGAQEAAGELGVTVTYQRPSTYDATQQIQLIKSLIAQNVNGLAISADDADALVPTGKDAMATGIPVISFDSAIAKDGRILHVNQAVTQDIGAIEIKMALDETGPDGGKIAILSATATAPNQNAWIDVMKSELQKPEYANLDLVDVVYGNDDDTESYNQALGLFTKYPDLKVIIAPTTVGIAASARAVTDKGLIGKVFVTGLGTPNQMRDYVKSGAAPEFALWNPSDLGYLSIYTLNALATKEITGKAGETYDAGKLGSYTIQDDPYLGLNVLLGPPTIFDKNNIDDFNF